MIKKDVTPSILSYSTAICDEALSKKELSPDIDTSYETELVAELSKYYASIRAGLKKLSCDTKAAEDESDSLKKAVLYHDTILSDMAAIRTAVDAAEAEIPSDYLTYPTYEEMLFSLR